jgi:flagellar biosynthetic protein FlhB
MAEQAGEKSLDATPHRRQKAHEQGQTAKSQDLAAAALLIAGLSALLLFGADLVWFFDDIMRGALGGDAWLTIDTAGVVSLWNYIWLGMARYVLPIMLVLVVVAVGLSLAQTGILFLPEKLAPDISHLDPIKGMSRIFSLVGAARLAFGLIKVVLVGAVAWYSLANQWETIVGMTAMDVLQIGTLMTEIVLWTSLKIAAALLLLAVLDYGFQWWKHEQDLKMTAQEVREEMKDLQGDPQMVSRRRSVQRQLAMSRLGSSVPKGDVTITNPTELAVTIQYDPETMKAPIVVAKGAGMVAQRIRRLSLEHGIPIVERKPLAQALYKEVEINRPIPAGMYAAVAEILAYVYQLKGKPMPKPPGS